MAPLKIRRHTIISTYTLCLDFCTRKSDPWKTIFVLLILPSQT